MGEDLDKNIARLVMCVGMCRGKAVADEGDVLSHAEAAAPRAGHGGAHQPQRGRPVVFQQRQHAAMVLEGSTVGRVVRAQRCGGEFLVPSRPRQIHRTEGGNDRHILGRRTLPRERRLGRDKGASGLGVGRRLCVAAQQRLDPNADAKPPHRRHWRRSPLRGERVDASQHTVQPVHMSTPEQVKRQRPDQ